MTACLLLSLRPLQISCGSCQVCLQPLPIPQFSAIVQSVPLTDTTVSIWILSSITLGGLQFQSSCTGKSGRSSRVSVLAFGRLGSRFFFLLLLPSPPLSLSLSLSLPALCLSQSAASFSSSTRPAALAARLMPTILASTATGSTASGCPFRSQETRFLQATTTLRRSRSTAFRKPAARPGHLCLSTERLAQTR